MMVVGLAGLLLLAVLLFFKRESPTEAASIFMSALAEGDSKTLAGLTYAPNKDKETVLKEWEFATRIGKHYRFAWRIRSTKVFSDGTAAINMEVERNLGSGASYGEKFELPMVQQDGKWKVDVASITRTMYPALPR